MDRLDDSELIREIQDLSPWHLDVDLRPQISTSSASLSHGRQDKHGPVAFVSDERRFKDALGALYPLGLQGRSFLDVACNCGAYSFWAKDLGAGHVFGFDVRDHWIKQAEFLRVNREPPYGDLAFQIADVYDLDHHVDTARGFDISLFKGILYHLPRPMEAIHRISEMTNEVLIVDTATRWTPGSRGWVLGSENTAISMNGVYPVNWYPSGPEVVESVLRSCGFSHFRYLYRRRVPRPVRQAGVMSYVRRLGARTGRFSLMAGRTPEVFAAFDSSGYRPVSPEGW